MDFGWPNVEIGWKMANGQLLFLALHVCDQANKNQPCRRMDTYISEYQFEIFNAA